MINVQLEKEWVLICCGSWCNEKAANRGHRECRRAYKRDNCLCMNSRLVSVAAHARSIQAACCSVGARGMQVHRMFLLAN